MEILRSILSKVLSRHGLRDHADSALIVHKAQQWFAEVLPALERDIEVLKLEGRTLHVRCRHSIAAQECQQLFSRLREYLLQECPTRPIENLRFSR
jgi:tRNA(Phe) wybutosine-synthesizing methylase Tyw3